MERNFKQITAPDEEARRSIAGRCLIAADVDRTIVAQGDRHEREGFLLNVGPRLIQAASFGAHLALLTGNNMDALTNRVLRWLIEQLCHVGDLGLLSRFHFCCNSGGVYARFPQGNDAISRLLRRNGRTDAGSVMEELTMATERGAGLAIRPQFIDPHYIQHTRIPDDDITQIQAVLVEVAERYTQRVSRERSKLEKNYDLAFLCENGDPIRAAAEVRTVAYGPDHDPLKATVQITLKPILSFRQARKPEQVFGKDLRSQVILEVQERLDRCGLGYCAVRAGGRSSVDVTLQKLDKAYALEFLIDRLNVAGCGREGLKLGSNTIYFGDEVIVGGGNDYPVTRIPGLVVFAVNSDRELIPSIHQVCVPSTILDGPDATAQVLGRFNECAHRLLAEWRHRPREGGRVKTAVEVLKEDIFAARINSRLAELRAAGDATVVDWQALHAFVSLMCRHDAGAKEWVSVLTTELDAIMSQVASARPPTSCGPNSGGAFAVG